MSVYAIDSISSSLTHSLIQLTLTPTFFLSNFLISVRRLDSFNKNKNKCKCVNNTLINPKGSEIQWNTAQGFSVIFFDVKFFGFFFKCLVDVFEIQANFFLKHSHAKKTVQIRTFYAILRTLFVNHCTSAIVVLTMNSVCIFVHSCTLSTKGVKIQTIENQWIPKTEWICAEFIQENTENNGKKMPKSQLSLTGRLSS